MRPRQRKRYEIGITKILKYGFFGTPKKIQKELQIETPLLSQPPTTNNVNKHQAIPIALPKTIPKLKKDGPTQKEIRPKNGVFGKTIVGSHPLTGILKKQLAWTLDTSIVF